MKVEADWELHPGPRLYIVGRDSKLGEMAHVFNLKDKPISLSSVFTPVAEGASNKMFGYLFGHLAPVAQAILFEAGWETITTKERAIRFYKKHLGFVESECNTLTGETEEHPKSFVGAPKEEVHSFIFRLFTELVEMGAEVMLPEEYFKLKRI